jgi:hypothetical protein
MAHKQKIKSHMLMTAPVSKCEQATNVLVWKNPVNISNCLINMLEK